MTVGESSLFLGKWSEIAMSTTGQVDLGFPEKLEDVTLDQTDQLLKAQSEYCKSLYLGAANFCHVKALHCEQKGDHVEAREFLKRAANQANLAGDNKLAFLYKNKILVSIDNHGQ